MAFSHFPLFISQGTKQRNKSKGLQNGISTHHSEIGKGDCLQRRPGGCTAALRGEGELWGVSSHPSSFILRHPSLHVHVCFCAFRYVFCKMTRLVSGLKTCLSYLAITVDLLSQKQCSVGVCLKYAFQYLSFCRCSAGSDPGFCARQASPQQLPYPQPQSSTQLTLQGLPWSFCVHSPSFYLVRHLHFDSLLAVLLKLPL